MTAMVAALGHGRVQHQCCWYVDAERPCGLWCGHDGGHVPHVGEYLPPPIISALWVLWFRQQAMAHAWKLLFCPLCGARPPQQRMPWEPGFEVFYGEEGLVFRAWRDVERITYERVWRFEPCGCEGRELLPSSYATGE